MGDIITEPEGGFESWKESQDFDYHRDESAVIDYMNSCIDYRKLDTSIEEDDDTDVAESFDSLDEDELAVVESHIDEYIKQVT